MEKFHITGSAIVQAVFYRHVVDKRFVLLCGVSGGHRATDDDTETVVPETFGKLEVVIRAPSSFDIVGRFHTKADVHRLAYHIRYLVLQEGIQGIVHIEATGGVSFCHVHARHQHRYCQLAPFFHAHGIELFLHGSVFGGFKGKCQAEVFQPVGQSNAHIKTHHTGSLAVATHIRPDAFGSLDVHFRIHHIARPVQVTSAPDVECLERNDGDFIFQFATHHRIASVEKHLALRCVLECQVAAPFHFHVIGAVGGQIDMRLYGLVDGNGHGNVHSREGRGRFPGIFHGHCIAEVDKFHHITEAVVHHERRILQHVCEVRLAEHIHVPTHLQLIDGTFQRGIHIYINLAVHGRLTVLRRIHQFVIARLHAKVHQHLFHVGEIHRTVDGKRCLIFGIDIELIEHQLAILHLDLLVVETETDRHVGHRQVNGIEFQATVQDGFHRTTRHGERSVDVTRKFHHPVGDERIGDLQREMLQFEFTCNVFASGFIGLIDTVQIDNFVIVMRNESVHIMLVFLARQIHCIQRPVA